MVVDNSLYMVEAPNWEKVVKVGPVLGKGSKQGVADLLYEEKIWHSLTGVWFSPSGAWLAFATFPSTTEQCCGQNSTVCSSGIPRVG